MSSPEPNPSSQRARSWAVRHPRAVLVVGCILAAIVIVAAVHALHLLGPDTNAPGGAAAASSGSFRLSDEQLRSMAVESIVVLPFRSEENTDGKIAYNGDTITSVYSQYSGHVTRLLAPLGAVVKRGQPLYELQASEYAQAESDLLSAAAQLRLTTAVEQRRHGQYDAHAGSLQDWQQSQSDLTAAQANLASVRNRLRILGKSDEEIDAIQSSARPDAAVRAMSPIGGVVVDRQIGPGQYLQAGGSTPVYTVADLSTVWLVANVRESDATRVHVGQSIAVHVLALPEQTFNARLSYVGAAVDPATRRVPVHAVLDNSGHLLKPEMYASFTIATSSDSMAPAVPQEAVIFEGAQARVWVMQSERDAAVRQVVLGRARDGKYEVLQGLKAGERVITHGALFIDRAASGG